MNIALRTSPTTRIETSAPQSTRRAEAAAAAITALLLLLPFAIRGYPEGHDLPFHLNSWYEVAQQLRAGILFPQWATLANFGLGEPRFVFYPPLSWMLGGVFALVMPLQLVPAVTAFLALSLAGYGASWFWRELPLRTSILGTVAYVANPYHLSLIYRRCAYSELLVCALFPLFLMALLRSWKWGRYFVPCASLFALIWLSNAPAAIMVTYSGVFVAVLVAVHRKSWKPVALTALSMGAGFGLVAFYIIPAASWRQWIHEQSIFQFSLDGQFIWGPVDSVPMFSVYLRVLAVVEAALFVASVFFVRRKKALPGVFVIWPGLACLAFVLMLPITRFLWNQAPMLHYVQFPWRWLLIFSLPLTVLGTHAIQAATRKRLLIMAFLIYSAANFLILQHDWHPARASRYVAQIAAAGGYRGMDEYSPRTANADKSEGLHPLPGLPFLSSANSALPLQCRALTATPYKRVYEVEAEQPTQIVAQLNAFPRWHVTVNEELVRSYAQAGTGFLLFEIPAGKSLVEIGYSRDSRSRLGILITGLTGALLVVSLLVLMRKRGL